jgi:2-dehydropantoate 2-reductase
MSDNSELATAPRRIGVLGPGAIGGLLAGRLIERGHHVTVIATERTAAVITASGLTMRLPGRDVVTTRPEARAWLGGPADILMIAVKATELLPALQRVPSAMVAGTTIVPFLNGVDHLPLLRSVYPESKVVAATIAVEATRHRPGVVEQLSPFSEIVVAPNSVELASLLSDAGFTVRSEEDENRVLWLKLAMLAPFALLTTGTGLPAGEARAKRPDWPGLLVAEAVAAAAKIGVSLDGEAAEARLRQMPASMQSSMLKDSLSGRPLELDAIAGPIIRALGAGQAPTTTAVVREILDNGQHKGLTPSSAGAR